MHKVSVEELQQASLKALEGHIEKLETDIGDMDYFFHAMLNFMGHSDMGDEDLNTPEWVLFRKMQNLYEEVDGRLRAAKYYYSVG